ncbi:MAG: biopolymer transporter ExbD [Polyangiales bacterium]
MAGVSTDSGAKGGRKSVDQQINMIPFIDLLVSLIAFLLMTAVWVQSGALAAQQPNNAPSDQVLAPPPPVDQLRVELAAGAFRVGTNAANITSIPRGPGELDRLRAALRTHRAQLTNHEVWVQPDSSVHFNDVARVMDAIYEVWGVSGSTPTAALPVTVRML